MSDSMTATTETADREIVMTRLFDAPRELVWKAWTDPKHLAQWWGPNGFTNTIHQMDVHPGGDWRFVIQGSDGVNYPNHYVFVEVVEPEHLTYDRVSSPRSQATATFVERDGKTELTMRMLFESAALREQVIEKFGAVEGLNQWLSRLGEYLASGMTALEDQETFLLTRVFDAPRDLVYQAWTTPEHLAQWWGPKGFILVNAKLELRPEGVFHYGLTSPNGQTMWGKWVFRDVVAPERIVFVSSFSDEEGNTTRAPFSEDWPLEVLSTVTFTAQEDGKTLLILRGTAINATEAERKAFVAGHSSMEKGFGGTLDQLSEYLATVS